MFESVTSRTRAPQNNLAGLVLSLLVCAGAGAGVLSLLSKQRTERDKEVDVTLFTARPPPPPPPPPPAGGGARSQPAEKRPIPRRRDVIVQPKVETKVEPKSEPADEPKTEAGVPGGVAGGVPGGVVGGVVGGVPGGVVGGVPGGTGNSALPFGLGMTRPQQISGTAPQYSREAIAARVEGKVIVRCIIAVSGEVRDCKVIKGVPILQDIVLEALRQSRYTPVTYQGHPEAVQYVFTFNFKLP
jgi:protein TonB